MSGCQPAKGLMMCLRMVRRAYPGGAPSRSSGEALVRILEAVTMDTFSPMGYAKLGHLRGATVIQNRVSRFWVDAKTGIYAKIWRSRLAKTCMKACAHAARRGILVSSQAPSRLVARYGGCPRRHCPLEHIPSRRRPLAKFDLRRPMQEVLAAASRVKAAQSARHA